jgi:hypothetical protein
VSITGDEIPQAIYLFSPTGVPLSYATKAAMQAAGWDLIWYDEDDVALSSQPTWTLQSAGDSEGRHPIRFIIPSGVWTCPVVKPSIEYYAAPAEFSGEGFSYDTDAIGSLIATSNGVALTPVTTADSAEIYMGDSIILDFAVTEAALTYIGAASLAAIDTLLAEIKLNTTDADQAATVGGLTESITSDTSGNRVVRAVLDAFPSALNVPDGAKSLACTAHLRATEGTKTAIIGEIALTIKWRATTS